MISVTTPVAVEAPRTANHFDLAYWQVVNKASGRLDVSPLDAAELVVFWNAWSKTTVADPTEEDPNHTKDVITIVKNCGPKEFSGTALAAICADSDARTQAYKTSGVPAALAEANGQRDAIQAALQASGDLPS